MGLPPREYGSICGISGRGNLCNISAIFYPSNFTGKAIFAFLWSLAKTSLVIQDIDIADLKRITELIQSKYGYDFRNYAMSSFKRRILRILELKNLSIEALLKKLNEQPGFIEEFLDELTVNVTEMFRDPGFWRVMRDEIIPGILLNHKSFKIWHAGCSSGEEVFSMAILLKEMGIHQDVTIYATDLDVNILEKAKT